MNKETEQEGKKGIPDTSLLMPDESADPSGKAEEIDENAGHYDEDEEEEKLFTPLRIVAFLVAALILLGTAVYYGCEIHTVEVTGNTYYAAREIKDYVIDSNTMMKHNSIYLPIMRILPFQKKIPFVEKVKVETTGLHSVKITVTEKKIDAYLPTQDGNLYITSDGVVQEVSPLTVKGITYIGGMKAATGTVGKKITSEEEGKVVLLLDVLQCLKKYEVGVEGINVERKGDISIYFGGIRVELGRSDYELKISKVAQLVPHLEGRSGTIDLSNYSSSDENIVLK